METNSKPMYQPWNEEEFQADVFVRGMTWLQRHLYRSLLCAAFFHGTRPYLPTDDDVLWVLAGAESPEMWAQNKMKILKRFTVCEHDSTLLENKRVTADWNRLSDARKRMSELGQKSAAIRSAFNGGSTAVERKLNQRVLTPNGSSTAADQVSEVSEEKETASEEKGCNAVGVSCSQDRAEWKNIAIPYRNVFRKKAGAEFKKRYFDACLKYTEPVVLECFHTWATQGTAEWCESNGFDRPLNLFFKKLPEEAADTLDLNIAEKEMKDKAAEEKQKSDEIQAASIERQTEEIVALMESRDVKRESEGSVEDFLASVEENG